MSQRTQVVLLVVISCFIVVLIGFNLAISRYGAFWKKEKGGPHLPAISLSRSFNSPVKNEYLETIPEYGQDADHPVFFLPSDTPVYALISGKISYVGQKITNGEIEFENIIITNDKEKLTVSYLLAAGTKILIEKDDAVSEGEEIAKAREAEGPACLGGGNLGVYLFKDGQPAKLTKEMFK